MNVKNISKAILSVILLSFYLLFSSCQGADSITANGYLTGDQIITSANGRFELGFFKPGKTSNYYIGIWYKNIPGPVVIWVANRDNPASDKYTSKLRVLNNGNLVLVCDECKSPIWSTNLNYSTSKAIKAVLLDNGNLVLREVSNMSYPYWESFNHPTDSFMPGSKFGINKITNSSIGFTSWKNSEDPGKGLFTYEHDPNASQLIMLWNKTRQYWSSGLWIPDQHIFSGIPELRFFPKQLSLEYVDNENESYLTYSVHDPAIITRFVMDVSGQFKDVTWMEDSKKWLLFWSEPGQQCEVYLFCGAFAICNQSALPYCHCLQGFEPRSAMEWQLHDFSGGCVRKNKLSCEGGKSADKFLAITGKILPESPHSIGVSTVEECESTCLRNCSCSAYSFDENACSIWFSELLNMRQLSDNSGETLYVRVAASEVHTSGKKTLIMGILIGLGLGLVVLFSLFSVVRWSSKRRLVIAAKTMQHSLARFRYKDLQSSTRNFSQKLGGGGFGSVFKGILPDSRVIAVKRLESISCTQGEKQFRAEVSAIGTIQHLNLVCLRGFCSEGSQRLLVYEYMPNGSLNTHLFRTENTQILSWRSRYNIAMGTARGLAYLHENCRDCTIHCDIKPENILLDAEFCPKVADFGLAKLVGREFSRVLTTIRGTRGYLAPEWISGEAITAKVDVYSYGMMLFELVSGRRNIQEASQGTLKFFPIYAMRKLNEGEDAITIVDPQLEGNAEKEEIIRICKLACWCIQDEEIQRPSMRQVVQVLEGLLDVNMTSIPWSFHVFDGSQESPMFFSELSSNRYSTQKTGFVSSTSASQDSSTYISAAS